jgi:MFS family permease
MGNLGQIIGMVSQAFLSGRYGRKASMYALWLVICAGCIIEVFSREWKSWLVAKLLGGIGVGCMQTTMPTYISEVAPTRIRGTFLMMYSVWWVTGQFFGTLALQVLSKKDPMDYLTPVYSQFAQVGVMLVIYLVLPESPSWLISRGSTECAKKALLFINRGVEDFDIDRQYSVALLALQHEKRIAAEQSREKWYAIFRGVNGWRTIVSCWCLMAQMFIGLGLFLTYGSYFFQQAGMEDPFAVVCITSGINIAATLVIVWMSEAKGLGRRRLATYGTTLCWTCNLLIGILGVVSLNSTVKGLLVFLAVLWSEYSSISFQQEIH